MIAAASANAYEYRYQTCEKAPKFNGHDTGKYTEGNCATVSETSEGAYERDPVDEGASLRLKGKSGPSIFYIYSLEKEELLRHSAGLVWKVECAKDKSSGEVTGPLSGWLKVTFSKCAVTHEPGGTPEKCKGKIETSKLATEIGVFLTRPRAKRLPTRGYRTLAAKCSSAENIPRRSLNSNAAPQSSNCPVASGIPK